MKGGFISLFNYVDCVNWPTDGARVWIFNYCVWFNCFLYKLFNLLITTLNMQDI